MLGSIHRLLFLASLAIGISAMASGFSGPTYTDLHDFGGIVRNGANASVKDGGLPETGITFDSAGNMYGTTVQGGLYGSGNIWSLTPTGKYTDLHDFGRKVKRSNGTMGLDGTQAGSVLVDKSGNLYGTTIFGGYYGGGILWKLSPKGVYTDLHDFANTAQTTTGLFVADGVSPIGLALDAKGNLYGTAIFGGLHGNGIAFKLAADGSYTDIHDFGGIMSYNGTTPLYDGMQPQGVVLDKSGNMFGVTVVGGVYGGPGGPQGIVWEITSKGDYLILHNFGGLVSGVGGGTTNDGGSMTGLVTFDKSGNLFGTTIGGGSAGLGAIWEISTNGAYSLIYEFSDSSKGNSPQTGVILDPNGNFYGTTFSGGLYGGGVLFELSSAGEYKDLHDFGGFSKIAGIKHPNPEDPTWLTFDKSGHIYGTTSQGGLHTGSTNDGGSIFVLK